ncbi:SagB/ThcOx family dehydrogenase [Thermosipho atlanticus]|uniref:SagB-type dehydrogenase domain-containing protein n=1 Tax=Thermosipho atlanticus DSM 15807 TaxID=1123380 RepID=A0A1M5T405_9BACT|nr:SagB/ThcOx family dehydrogenase [Thermosipho atlanticus]SHH45412.1 SagB-type dehydrogenase domain-containing protein [Thermosipho atlanticus DSM 15807]
MEKTREFLKSSWRNIKETDRKKGLPKPPVEKPYNKLDTVIDLPKFNDFNDLGSARLIDLISKRRSRRKYSTSPLSLKELSFLLWSTQGVSKYIKEKEVVFKTVPSAGACHPFETYLVVFDVEGLEKGIYRFLSLEHKLLLLKTGDFSKEIIDATLGQQFIGNSSVVFVWAAIPYRTEWKYAQESYKAIALDAGHICQNLYLATESIGCGTCAVAAYDQEKMDQLIGLDGQNEFVVYLAPVGKL